MAPRLIEIHPLAPTKPALGSPCNGCGLCCLAEPCPLGMLLSRRRHGACVALGWNEEARQYRCGVVTDARRWLPWLPAALSRGLALRWIAAAKGCDADMRAV